jgi:ribonuclease P protein subunit RPR2
MIRVARERISDLFGLAEQEARLGRGALSDRYVRLARRIGTRYNVRLLVEYRDLYCRGCSSYWVEGRTLRTRLREGRRVQTCLQCGRVRRVPIRSRRGARETTDTDRTRPLAAGEPVLVDEGSESPFEGDEGEEE